MRERLTRLAELIRKDGAPYQLTPQLVNVWVDVFSRADVSAEQAEGAFDKAERSLKAFWPSPGEVLALVSTIHASAAEEQASVKFTQVLEYAVRCSPDIPEKNPPRISEHTRRAINAAGGLDYLRDCDHESLQWARKRFMEAYVRYSELQHGEHLLPPGEVRDLLASAAQQKLLPASDSYEDGRARGLAHAQELKDLGVGQPDIKRAIRVVAGELAPRPLMRPLEEQKHILREKGFLPKEECSDVLP